jgi:hypothetical protein
MKKALWIVWVYAVLWNGYATWLWVHGLVRVGFPRTDLYSYVVILSPAVSLIALLWAISHHRSGALAAI